MIRLNVKLQRGIAVVGECLLGKRNSHSKPLHEPKRFQGLCKLRIPIVCDSRRAEVVNRDLPKRPSGVLDLDPVRKPRDSNRCICGLIIAVHYGVADYLLKCNDRVVRMFHFGGTGRDVRRHVDVRTKQVVETTEKIGQGAVYFLLVGNRIGESSPVDAQELNVRSGDEIRRCLPQYQQPCDSWIMRCINRHKTQRG